MAWFGDDGPPSGHTQREVENALRQIDYVRAFAEQTIGTSASFTLTPDFVSRLNAIAMDGLRDEPGAFRRADEPILGSKHKPPPWTTVPNLMTEMCEYVNARPPRFFVGAPTMLDTIEVLCLAIHVAAYALWRLCWIHPFDDGNGRTSRALCYPMLCVHTRMVAPGVKTMPERMAGERVKFYRCLDAADEAHRHRRGQIKLQQLEVFVKRHFIAQLQDWTKQNE